MIQSRIAVGISVGIAIGLATKNLGAGIVIGLFVFILPSLLKQRVTKKAKS
ncbi:MAG: hypothetical protein HYR66_15345 [Sphingobacteriales bacterium]|nr:hypothetical protein [Sphingobacteriales bacterium]MBI3718085.1 hypothetical protein [Sphingobacteriales bacterium]